MQIRQKSIGLRKDLTRFGETLSAKSSTQHITGAIRAIGSMEDVYVVSMTGMKPKRYAQFCPRNVPYLMPSVAPLIMVTKSG
jgi:hypothetical protein